MNIDKRYLTGAVFVDHHKAFETVDHARLLSKLPPYSIIGRELRWFEIYLFKTETISDRVRSDTESSICMAPQGSILASPLVGTGEEQSNPTCR